MKGKKMRAKRFQRYRRLLAFLLVVAVAVSPMSVSAMTVSEGEAQEPGTSEHTDSAALEAPYGDFEAGSSENTSDGQQSQTDAVGVSASDPQTADSEADLTNQADSDTQVADGSGSADGEQSDDSDSAQVKEAGVWDGVEAETAWYDDHAGDSVFTISTPAQLAGLAKLVNESKITFKDKTVRLGGDLDMGGKEWTPIGNNNTTSGGMTYKFSGVFDGQGYTISNVKIDDAANFNRGFFSYLEEASIEDLTLQIDIAGGKSYIGGVAAVAQDSSFENITVKGSISRAENASSATSYVGGIVGSTKNSVTISNCTNEMSINAEVSAEDASYHNSSYVGGIVGNAVKADLRDCVNRGKIGGGYAVGGIVGQTFTNASSIVRCVNYGDICANRSGTTKSYSAGGILGYSYKSDEIKDCANFGDISANVYSAGGIVGCAYATGASIQNCYNAGAVKNRYATGCAAGIIATVGTYSRIDISIDTCYNRGTVSGDAATKGGIIAYQYKTPLSEDYVKNNWYLAGTAEFGFGQESADPAGMTTKFDSSSDYSQLISALGAAYQNDLTPQVNDGFPILRWQDPDAVYSVVLKLEKDTEINDGGQTSVVVKSSAGTVQESVENQADEYRFELPNDTYTYEVTKQGYLGKADAEHISGSFTVDKESQEISIPLTAQKYEWKIRVTTPDADLVLKDAENNIVEPAGKENQDNEVAASETVYTYELYNGTYHYSASKFGYEEGAPQDPETGAVEGDITVNFAGGEQTVYLASTSDLGKLTFAVSAADGGELTPVVSITAEEGDYAGKIVYSGSAVSNILFPAGKYTYTVKASGYQKAEGSFELTAAHMSSPLTISVSLVPSSEWDGQTADTDWYTSHADETDFYIYTPEELAGLAKLVNDGTDNFSGKTVHLMSNLDLGSGQWMPIGGYAAGGTKCFAGTFDGHGCTVTVSDGIFAANETGFGLFGYIKGSSADRAAVKNLILYGNVKAESGAYTYIGGLTGYATYTDFSNISNRMNLTVHVNTSSMGFIDLGGLVGWSVLNNFYSCSNQGNISGVMNSSAGRAICYVGGIAGMATQATSANQVTITDCYNNGNISSEGGTTTSAGGIIGYTYANGVYGTMSNCYNSGTISSGNPLLGSGSYGGGNNYYLDTTLGSGQTSTGEPKTDAELRELAPTLGDKYKSGSTYPVLYWEAAPYSIAIAKNPDKTEYDDFDFFDDTGLQLTVYYSQSDADAGVNGSVVVSGWQIGEDGKSLHAGQDAVTVSYMGASCKVPVTVNQVVHYITSDDLKFDIAAPTEGATPQSEIQLTESQSGKIASASIVWYADGEKMDSGDTFRKDVYYRAAVELKSVYEDGNVWYNFKNDAKPSVSDTYEILYRTLSDSSRTMSFTLTWKVSDTLTDTASHRYYTGDDRTPADYAQYLDSELVVTADGEKTVYTVKELETAALTAGIERIYSYQGLNSRKNYTMTGMPLYDLLKEVCPKIVNASDDSVITVGGKDFILGALRQKGGSYDAEGGKLESDLPYLLAYGCDGRPYTSEKGPLYLAAPALSEGEDNSGNFVANVSEITVNLVTAKTYQVTFSAVDAEENPIEDAVLTIKDGYGNIVYSGALKTVELNNGETYTYAITAPGYGTKNGEVSGASTVKAELLKVWTGELIEPATDENGAYLIYTADELMWFNHEATCVSNERSMEMMAADIKLMADIDLSGTEGKWLPMGALNGNSSIYFYVVNPDLPRYFGGGEYSGTFDGNGHVIRNLNIDWENYYELELSWDGSVLSFGYRLEYIGGLFGMAKGATIKNVGVEGNISVLDRPVSTLADWCQMGGLVGFASGDTVISGCYSDVNLDYRIDHGNETLQGYPYAGYPDKCDLYMGGIVGSLSMSLSGEDRNLVENCYSLGDMSGEGVRTIRAGGIVGATRNYINTITKCWSSSDIAVSPSSYGESEMLPVYVGGIIGDVNSVPMSENNTEISYCFALNPSLSIEMDSKYAHVNRVIGNEEFAEYEGTAKYNFGLSGMKINGAVYTVPENDQSYRSASGRSIAAERAQNEKAYTNVYWNDEEEVWSFTEGQYPALIWEKSEITINKDPDNGSNGGSGSGSGSSGGSGGSSSGGNSGNNNGNGTNNGNNPGNGQNNNGGGQNASCDGGESCPVRGYTDVDTSAWYHEYLDFAVEKGLFEGLSETQFSPDGSMTRGMFATVLARMEKAQGRKTDGHVNGFSDVASGSWYEEGIAWAADAGVVKGIGEGRFAPNQNITREQLAAMMYRYAEYLKLNMETSGKSLSFADSGSVSDYAKNAVLWSYENGIMTGKGENRIDPQGNASRAEVAAVMMRFSDLVS